MRGDFSRLAETSGGVGYRGFYDLEMLQMNHNHVIDLPARVPSMFLITPFQFFIAQARWHKRCTAILFMASAWKSGSLTAAGLSFFFPHAKS
jgi:hypothetical protein